MKPLIKITMLFCFLLVVTGCKEKPVPTFKAEEIALNGVTINAPKTIENLSLFILTGKEKVIGKSYNTLSEAMERKQVTVKETGSVNELSIDNNSSEHVFIHSGDIVKGGKQDRTISYDIIIPPHTKNVALESFCVEQGRWSQRSDEEVAAFSTNTKMLSSRDLKLAAKHEKNQHKVWNKVSEQKQYLNEKLSARKGYEVDVAADESNSSLQLALENEELTKSKDSIYTQLKDLIEIPDAIGYAYAINGEIYGVEVYNNKQLFTDLWDKVLESVIVEAISKEGEQVGAAKTKKDVLAYMQAVKASDKQTAKKLNKVTNFKTLENKKGNIVFSTEDLEKQKWIHKSYMKVDTSASSKNKSELMSSQLRVEY